MSAYIVDKYHIDAILTAFKETGRVLMDLDRIGQILVNANFKSVNVRYGMKDKPYKYEFKAVKKYNAMQIYVACDCLNYQSCEYDGWKRSKAKRLLEKIRTAVMENSQEWQNAKWHLEGVEK